MAITERASAPQSVLQSFASLSTRSFTKAREFLSTYSKAPNAEELYQTQDVQLTREKCRASVLAALVADAAGSNIHRMKKGDLGELAADARFQANPEFYVNSADEVLTVGSLSPLGVLNLPLLQSLLYHGGFDGAHYTSTAYDFYKQYSGTKTALIERFVLAMDHDHGFPVSLHANTCECLCKVPIMVARYAGKPEMLGKVRDAVRALQQTNDALSLSAALAQILERVVLGCSVLEALSWAQEPGVMDSSVQRHVQTVLQSTSIPHSVFVAKHGRSDRLPGAFLSSLHAAAIASSFEDGVRQTLKAGGACSGRAQVVGALLAAEGGMAAIPGSWIAEVTKYAEYVESVDKLISHRAIITIGQPFRTY